MQILRGKFKIIHLDVYYSRELSVILLKRHAGVAFVNVPSYHFVKIWDRGFSIIFEKFQSFQGFLRAFTNVNDQLSHFYSMRIKMRGLGYYIDAHSTNYLSFDFNHTSLFYFHVPKDMILKVYKRRLFMLTLSRSFLKTIVAEVLLLKELGPYRLLGLRTPRSIHLIRKRKIVK